MSSMPSPVTAIFLIVALGTLPFATLMVTSYTKLVVVLGLLRTALGVQQVPPNIVLNGIALILTIYIMAPVGGSILDKMQEDHVSIGSSLSVDDVVAIGQAISPPLKKFLEQHTVPGERNFFMRSATAIWPAERVQTLKADDLMVLVPSFMLSELTRAFQIGFVIYVVFVVTDLIVANVLLALGMQMISPTTISIPFKLLLFVMLDGWSLLVHGLVLSYR